MSEYNIYCDESCHIPNDNADLMVIGALSCPKEKVEMINKSIFAIKEKHGVYKYAEIKWTKVSDSKYEMYKELVELFLDNAFLNFRAVVALGKKSLDLNKFNLDYDDWYQRIYFLTLREIIHIGHEYNVYVDIKDTKGSEKIDELKNVINNAVGSYFCDETVRKIQLIRSDQIQLSQLADLFIGAVAYKNRLLEGNEAKNKLISFIEQSVGRNLNMTSPKYEDKINVFRWMPQEA